MHLAQDLIVALFVISMMVSVGLDLTWRRLWALRARPGALVGGLVAGYVCVPLVALGLVWGLALPSAVGAGLLLCAAAPGGPVGALFTQRADGDLALGVALLMLVNLINGVATPLTLQALGATAGGDLWGELLGMSGTIVAFQILPLGVGLGVREYRSAWASRLLPWVRGLANVLVLALTGVMVVARGEVLLAIPLPSLLAAEGMVLAGLCSGWLLVPGDRRARTAGALFNGVRSQSLAVLLASTRFPDPATLMMVLCYSAVMFLNCLAAAAFFRRLQPTRELS